MVPAVIDPESGLLATDWCPNRVREWFKPNEVPGEACNLHNEWTQRVITENPEPGVPGGARAPSARRQSDVERILDNLKKGLGRIFGGRPR
jgi:hypothetical protein